MQAKKDSATALSNGVPGFEKEDFTFRPLKCLRNSNAVYCDP